MTNPNSISAPLDEAALSPKVQARNDILSGLTVALALIPEAVAFAFVAGIDPLYGLYAAFMVGLITSVFGGRPGMISGATGALAVVMVALVQQGNGLGLQYEVINLIETGRDLGLGEEALRLLKSGEGLTSMPEILELIPSDKEHGVQYLFAAVVLMGLIQILAGIFRLGKFIRLVPHPVMIGFVNGLAIIIGKAQFGQFKMTNTVTGELEWISGSMLWVTLSLIMLTMAILYFLPKLTKAVPAALVAIVGVTMVVAFVPSLETLTVIDFLKDRSGDAAASIKLDGWFPPFLIPDVPLNMDTLMFILPYAFILASIGLIESLMTLTLVDELTNTRGRSNKECIGQGTANILTGFFSGMGGCAMIGQSIINIKSGGRGRLSGIAAALALLAFIVFGAPLIEMIPLAALIGVMFMVVFGTFEWTTFRILGKIPLSDAFVIILVTAVTVVTDLAIAVGSGIIVSALIFAWKHATHIEASTTESREGWKTYQLTGPLFFGSCTSFKELFDIKNDPKDVVADFMDSRVSDHSALEAIHAIAEKYRAANKTLHLRHLSADCVLMLEKAGDLVEVNVLEDPEYFVAADELA